MNYGIGNVKSVDKGKALFTTTTAPTESGDVITLATTDIVESGFKVGDYLAYVDSDNISALYSISAISSGTATLTFIGGFASGGGGAGTPLYIHNIGFHGTCNDGSNKQVRGGVSIINDSATALTETTLKNYLLTKGFIITTGDSSTYNKFYVNASFQATSTYTCRGIAVNSDGSALYTQTTNAKDGYIASIDEWLDTVIPFGTASINGGGGTQLYQHNIFLYGSAKGARVRLQITNRESTPYTLATLKDWFTAKGYTSSANQYWWVYGAVSDTNYTAVSIPTGLYLENTNLMCAYSYSPSGATSSPISELIFDVVETL